MTSTTHLLQSSQPRRGLTLLELSLGLSITAIIGLAIMGLSAAVSSAWAFNSDRGLQTVAEEQLRARAAIEREIDKALAVGYSSGIPTAAPASAWLVLWANDDLPSDAGNDTAQYFELRFLEASPIDGCVYLWVAKPWDDVEEEVQALLAEAVGGDFNRTDAVTVAIGSGAFVRHRLYGNTDGPTVVTGGGFDADYTESALPQTVVRYEITAQREGTAQNLGGLIVRNRSDLDVSGGG